MNFQTKRIGYVTAVLAIVSLVAAYHADQGFWQDLLVSFGTTFFSLGLVVIVVNHALASADKRLAAGPVLKLILPNVRKLHNELFIVHLQNELGKDQFESLVEIYQRHKRNPNAFSPDQRDSLYQAILVQKDEILATQETLQEQLRELTLLLGWSFDSSIIRAALDARLNFATFKSSTWDNTVETKKSVIESFLDGEAATSAVVTALTKHLGLTEDQYMSDS